MTSRGRRTLSPPLQVVGLSVSDRKATPSCLSDPGRRLFSEEKGSLRATKLSVCTTTIFQETKLLSSLIIFCDRRTPLMTVSGGDKRPSTKRISFRSPRAEDKYRCTFRGLVSPWTKVSTLRPVGHRLRMCSKRSFSGLKTVGTVEREVGIKRFGGLERLNIGHTRA